MACTIFDHMVKNCMHITRTQTQIIYVTHLPSSNPHGMHEAAAFLTEALFRPTSGLKLLPPCDIYTHAHTHTRTHMIAQTQLFNVLFVVSLFKVLFVVSNTDTDIDINHPTSGPHSLI